MRSGMTALHKTLVYGARAHWALALAYVVLPFAYGARVGSTVSTGSFFGAIVFAIMGLLLYGSSRFAARDYAGSPMAYLLWFIAIVAWIAIVVFALLAVWLLIEPPAAR